MQAACIESLDALVPHAAAIAAPPVKTIEAVREKMRDDKVVISDMDGSDSAEPTTAVGFGIIASAHASMHVLETQTCTCKCTRKTCTCAKPSRTNGNCGVAHARAYAQDGGECCERVAS